MGRGNLFRFSARYCSSDASDHAELTGGGVDEKITLRIAAGDGKGELLGRDVAIERPDLQHAHTCRGVFQNGRIVDRNLGQRGVVVLVQNLHVHLNQSGLNYLQGDGLQVPAIVYVEKNSKKKVATWREIESIRVFLGR